MATKNVERRIQEARLIVSRPEQVFDELQKYGEQTKDEFLGGDKSLEASMLARNDPLIDLALASAATEAEVLASLYKRARVPPKDATHERYLLGLRVAVLSN